MAAERALPRKVVDFFRNNSLSMVLFLLFLASFYIQSLTGVYAYNQEHAGHRLGYWAYLSTGHFLDAIFKNWEGAVLQLGTLIVLGAVLHQRGASHSRKPGQSGERRGRRQGGGRKQPKGAKGWIYRHSLGLAFFGMFAVFLLLHVVYGAAAHNEKAELMHQSTISASDYFLSADCWFQLSQTWQAEFFAIGAFVVLSIFLREQGSAESKPDEAGNRETGTEEQ